jgi:outer membrane protein insertion porin family
MFKQSARIAAVLLLCALSSLAQKKAPSAPRKAPAPAIRFQGAPQYAQEELIAAAGFKPGVRLVASEVKARAKQLNDTGLFTAIKFSSDSKGLLFSLTPSSQLFPMHLDNLPLQPGKDLDAKIHARFPLYHGLLPASGSMLEGIRQMFEETLSAEGIKAAVKAVLTSGLGPKKITAIDFTITAPSVRIGPIRLSGISPAMQAGANTLVAGQTGNAFDTENTAIGLEHAFEDLYQDQGYAAVEVAVTQIDPPIISGQSSDSAVAIPFAVAIKEGGVYKLGAITYPADALVPRPEVEKVLSKYQAGSGRPLDLFLLAVRDAYHAHGYLDCSVVSHAAFNEATHIVNYSLEIVPGPIYQMGSVHFDGAPNDMSARLTRLWKMAPGQPFDESYVSTFAARAQKQDRSLAKWMQTVITSFDVKPDPATHQVNCIFHFAKAQNAH